MNDVIIQSGYVYNKGNEEINVTLLCDGVEVRVAHIPPKSARKYPPGYNNVEISVVDKCNVNENEFKPYSDDLCGINFSKEIHKLNVAKLNYTINEKTYSIDMKLEIKQFLMYGYFSYEDVHNTIRIEYDQSKKTSSATLYTSKFKKICLSGTIESTNQTSKIILLSSENLAVHKLEIDIDNANDQMPNINQKLSGKYIGYSIFGLGYTQTDFELQSYENSLIHSFGIFRLRQTEGFGYFNQEENIFMLVFTTSCPYTILVGKLEDYNEEDQQNIVIEGEAYFDQRANTFTIMKAD